METDHETEELGRRKIRSRGGCLNCKRRKRKCDEQRPICAGCSKKKETCEWGLRITFRSENAQGLLASHPSMQQRNRPSRRSARFEIKDVTDEVIRNYEQQEALDESSFSVLPQEFFDVENVNDQPECDDRLGDQLDAANSEDTIHQTKGNTPDAIDLVPAAQGSMYGPSHMPMSLSTPDDVAQLWASPVVSGLYDDGIFLPGSAYLDLHSTLRSHLMHEFRSASLPPLQPNIYADGQDWTMGEVIDSHNEAKRPDAQPGSHAGAFPSTYLYTPQSCSIQLSDEEEYILWENWLEEIAPWLDKFDNERHFQLTLPILARSHEHLRYSMLAVSARQIERKAQNQNTEHSLALYQMAIHHVLPRLHTRSTAVIASCVVLCVLEMLSSSPKAWRQHLDGCAHLIKAVGINGFMGGLDQALFWCFARMDVCGGLIASMKTLIPVNHWIPGGNLDADVELFSSKRTFDMHACHITYLCAHALDLLSHCSRPAERLGLSASAPREGSAEYSEDWKKLWKCLENWHANRPDQMLPVSYFLSSESPFPRILYSNPAAISGNQLYHTASMLMLQHKPVHMALTPKPQSIFWHARQICGISKSNHHHGAWTNSIQPLWIAGQWMSHPSEHEAILELLEKIEKETGWGTKWRAEDLKEFWGEEDG